MKPKVYIETTIPSYLTAKPSRDPLVAANQRQTRIWWESHRHRFDLFVSANVIREAGFGNPRAARMRLLALQRIPVLELKQEADDLAAKFLAAGALPVYALDDALHVAIATANGMHYLLTWNCRHIANPVIVARLAKIAAAFGLSLPVLCTPGQLMGN